MHGGNDNFTLKSYLCYWNYYSKKTLIPKITNSQRLYLRCWHLGAEIIVHLHKVQKNYAWVSAVLSPLYPSFDCSSARKRRNRGRKDRGRLITKGMIEEGWRAVCSCTIIQLHHPASSISIYPYFTCYLSVYPSGTFFLYFSPFSFTVLSLCMSVCGDWNWVQDLLTFIFYWCKFVFSLANVFDLLVAYYDFFIGPRAQNNILQ